jgi:DUF4097 and DUF4098 domain-containing protein YvlB
MAGYPPSYPPPAGPPFGFDPKQQARAARQQARLARQQYKAQARAAVLAAKTQRDLYRLQTRSFRRSSILGPVIVLAIGVIFLLLRIGHIPFGQFLVWYGHWWPMLLVGAGVILVAEWALDQVPRADGAPHVRRGIGGGAIFLLLALAITGAAFHGIHDGRAVLLRNFGLSPDSLNEFFGEKHEMTEQFDVDLPAGTPLVLNNPHGDVTIAGKSGDNKIHITLSKQVWSQSDSDADSKAGQLHPRVSTRDNTFAVSIPAVDGGVADIDVTLPDSAETTVTANHGDVSVSGMHAPVTVTANHGDIEFNAVTGAVAAHANHRDATVSAHNITGDVSVQGHAEDVNVTDVSGQTSLEGEFLGDIHLEHLHGPVSFRTNRTQLSLARLNGQLDISPKSELSASDIVGPTRLQTRSRNITFERIAGDIDVSNSDGSVDLVATAPLGNVSVDDRNGEVNLTLPDHAAFTIDAETRGGEINTDLDLKPVTQNDTATLQGAVGKGGPHIMLRTTHLNIAIHARAGAPAPAPSQPQAPPAPSTKSGA